MSLRCAVVVVVLSAGACERARSHAVVGPPTLDAAATSDTSSDHPSSQAPDGGPTTSPDASATRDAPLASDDSAIVDAPATEGGPGNVDSGGDASSGSGGGNFAGFWLGTSLVVMQQENDALVVRFTDGPGPYTGRVIDARRLELVFGNNCCTGTLSEDGNTIRWSNNTLWRRKYPAAQVDGAPDAGAPVAGTPTTATTHRREIGRVGDCTATLVGARWILTSAQCFGSFDAVDGPPTAHPRFQTSSDGSRWGVAGCAADGCEDHEVERTFAFNSATPVNGPDDLMLMRLGSAAAASFVTPATVASVAPTMGSYTVWGRGCGGSSEPDQMRYLEAAVGQPATLNCPGELGGPAVIGGAADRGAVFGVRSLGRLADLVDPRVRLQALMREWDDHADLGIGPSWCTGASERLFFGDSNGDREPDAYCHDATTGRVTLARSTGRLLQPAWQSKEGFCAGTGRTLHSGDFNGDGRTDLLCHQRAVSIEIDYADTSGTFSAEGKPDWSLSTTYCSSADQRLLMADANGDGRTDLFCHDFWSGQKQLDYADADGHFSGPDWAIADVYCSHTGAQLYVGEFNGDKQTDLACHTPKGGQLHVTYAKLGTDPYVNDVNDYTFEWLSTSRSCNRDGDCGRDELCVEVLGVRSCWGPFCGQTGDVLTIADYTGDGLSDVLCKRQDGSTVGTRAWGGDRSKLGKSKLFDWTGSYPLGWAGGARPRQLDAASQPWSSRLR